MLCFALLRATINNSPKLITTKRTQQNLFASSRTCSFENSGFKLPAVLKRLPSLPFLFVHLFVHLFVRLFVLLFPPA